MVRLSKKVANQAELFPPDIPSPEALILDSLIFEAYSFPITPLPSQTSELGTNSGMGQRLMPLGMGAPLVSLKSPSSSTTLSWCLALQSTTFLACGALQVSPIYIISMQTAVAQALRVEMEQLRLLLTKQMVREIHGETERVLEWRPGEGSGNAGRRLDDAVVLETPVKEKTPQKIERNRSSSKKKISLTLHSNSKRDELSKMQAQKRQELYSSLFYQTPAKNVEMHPHLKSTYQQQTFGTDKRAKRIDWEDLISVGTERELERAASGKRGRMINKLADLSEH